MRAAVSWRALAYFLAALPASFVPTLMVFGARTFATTKPPMYGIHSLQELVTELVEAWTIGYLATLFLGIIPFVITLWVAKRKRLCRPRGYMLAGAISVMTPSVLAALLSLPTLGLASFAPLMPPLLFGWGISEFSSWRTDFPYLNEAIILLMFYAPGAIAGYVYWLFAQKHPPISEWARSETSQS